MLALKSLCHTRKVNQLVASFKRIRALITDLTLRERKHKL